MPDLEGRQAFYIVDAANAATADRLAVVVLDYADALTRQGPSSASGTTAMPSGLR